MKQNEFELINAINRDGIDSSLWGLCSSDVNASAYDEQFDEMLPPHLYVYGADDEIYGCELGRMLRDGCDRKLYYDPTHYVAFFWLQIVPSADEVAAQLEAAEHFDSMQAYFESLPDGGVAGRVLGWLPSRSVNLC